MDLLICGTCGAQHDSMSGKTCKICDDPRQFVPPEGQWFTTLRAMRDSGKYKNVFKPDPFHSGVVAIATEPLFAIGQNAFLLRDPEAGNILWDCITYIDDDTVRRIKDLGGIDAIVVSHPHFFSAALEWADAFGCRVYISAEDGEWLRRRGPAHELWEGPTLELLGGKFVAIKVGGHFPGSAVMLWKNERKIFTADSIAVIPSGENPIGRREGRNSFAFMWSYPNMIPLTPEAVHGIWKAMAPFEFDDAHGAFFGRVVRGDARKRLLESAQMIVEKTGYTDHAVHKETL
ncbi:metallo-beta-lactamase superfamily protein [Plectosphaerella plurivora]|uniref:Metallo-beta-lactamase superfamily protein n=1 Tax=Plectosphaerella plurivora TaxID=936078 RepID=A0A9P8VK73_9PEZI|nr:metallo-beta-lactamase superfamily protein [Plectosphaerella plurivora]